MKYPVFYVDKLPVAGRANGPVIRILKTYRDDYGLFQHELTHVKQWFVIGLAFTIPPTMLAYLFGMRPLGLFGMTMFNVLYFFVDDFRLRAEVEAYRVQAKYYDDYRLDKFASFIATRYKLSITQEEALKLLRGD